MRFINPAEVDEPTFEDIMTTKIDFFEDVTADEARRYCKDRAITYLPSKLDRASVFKLEGSSFLRIPIEETQTVAPAKKIFDEDVSELFNKNEVIFVFDKGRIIGITHFCDYNRDPVFIYLYSKMLKFEKKLRETLIRKGLNNSHMKDFFAGKSYENEVYAEKLVGFDKLHLKALEPFQCFLLTDLLSLLARNGISINQEPITAMRNHIMHIKNVIKNKDYEKANLIYDFASFEGLIKSFKEFKKTNELL